MKGRLNNQMREDMQNALLAHAYRSREAELNREAVGLRNEAIRRLLSAEQIAAIATVVPLIYEAGQRNWGNVTWGSDISVNCGGPNITLTSGDSRACDPVEGALPWLRPLRDNRVDLPADDELAVRVQDWADRREAFNSERRVSSEQIKAALAAFSTVSQMQASWPEVMPVVQDILVEHLGRPAPSLPAVVLTEMNAKLGLPPSNDDGIRDQAAA